MSILLAVIFGVAIVLVVKSSETVGQSNASPTTPAPTSSIASQVSKVLGGQEPPVVTGDIIEVWAHPQHTETSGLDTNGNPMPKESFDQVLVFAEARLHNQGKVPLFLLTILTNATLPDGIHSSSAASESDYDRVFLAYPDIPVPHGEGLPINLVLGPGQIIDGTFDLARAKRIP